jgi:hypothetical protein
MGEMARVNRSSRWWFGGVLAFAVAAVLVLAHSCDSADAPPDATPAERSPEVVATPRALPKPERRPRIREAAEPLPTPDAPLQPPQAAKQGVPKTHELRVLRADGTPAAGARVLMSHRPLWDDWPGSSMWTFRATDAEGRAVLSSTQTVPYVSLGPDVGWSYKPGSVLPLPEVRLRPGVIVRGRTIDSDSRPVPSANVRAEMFPPGAGASIVVEATSNADGEFELPPLPFDEQGNGRQDIEIVAYADGLVPGSATTTRTDAPKGPVVLTLYRGGALRGRLVRADEKALSSVRVVLAGTHLAAFPDAEGRFELRLPAQGGEVIVQDGISSTSESVFRPAAGTFVAARRLGTFRGDAGDRDLGDITVDGGKPVRGVVVLMKSEPYWDKAFPGVAALMNGGPVADARVSAVLAGMEILSVTTDASGAFELPLSGDEHDLVVNERTSSPINRTPAVEGVRGGDPDVRIVRGRMGIRVRLRDENGAKLEPAGVHVNASLHGQTDGHAYADGYHGRAELDAARSELRVQLPVEGAYDLSVHSSEFEIVKIENIDVRADRDAEIDVRLRKKP